jgi:hypothetical protein
MTEGELRSAPFQENSRLLITGAVLAGVGSLLGLAGLTLSMGALAGATRRWINEVQIPPSELARQQWARAKAATTAGASAWRNGMEQPASRPARSARRPHADPKSS